MTSFLSRHRSKLLPASVTAILLILALVFWKPLIAWFGGEPIGKGDSPASEGARSDSAVTPDAAHVNAPTVLPAVELSPATFARIHAAFSATDQVRAALASDSLQGVSAQATSVGAALDAAAGDPTLSVPLRTHLVAAGDDARALAQSDSLASAREQFGVLSGTLIALADADPRLAEGWHIYQCPMTESHGKWFQREGPLENPYMGKEMLTCGSRSDWELAGQTTEAEHAHAPTEAGEVAYYTCSMHPSVKQEGPGDCPICGMDLTPVTEEQVKTGILFVDEGRRQRIGMRTAPAQTRAMELPIRAVGEVVYDEGRLTDVSLRMSGWVQKLLVNETGQKVKKGQTLFTLYSPELYAAQLEHLATVKRASGASATFAKLARASQSRLRLLGMSEGQIRQLERRQSAQEKMPIAAPASGYVIEKNVVEGAEIKAGTQVYRLANLDSVWIDAEVYEPDLPFVKLGQKVIVELPFVPGKTYPGTVDYIHPTLDAETRTGTIRVVLKNPDLALKPAMYATARIDVPLGERLTIPDSAVLYSGPRRIVFVDLGEGRLRPQEIELGVFAGGYYEVVSGLAPGDSVVTSGNFLIAAESRLRSATTFWADKKKTDTNHPDGSDAGGH